MAREPRPYEVTDQGGCDRVMAGAACEAGLAETATAAAGASVGQGPSCADGAKESDLSQCVAGTLECKDGPPRKEREQEAADARQGNGRGWVVVVTRGDK
jgi:hypothetical protein